MAPCMTMTTTTLQRNEGRPSSRSSLNQLKKLDSTSSRRTGSIRPRKPHGCSDTVMLPGKKRAAIQANMTAGAISPLLRLNGVGSVEAAVTPKLRQCLGQTAGHLAHSSTLSDTRTVLLFQDCNPARLPKLEAALIKPGLMPFEEFHLVKSSEAALKQQVAAVKALQKLQAGHDGGGEAEAALRALRQPVNVVLGVTWQQASDDVRRDAPV